MPVYAFESKLIGFNDADGDPPPLRVIEAKNESQATDYFLKDTVTVRKATATDFMALGKAGCEIEVAN